MWDMGLRHPWSPHPILASPIEEGLASLNEDEPRPQFYPCIPCLGV